MKDLPDSFWAALFIGMACTLGIICLFAPSAKENVTMALVTMSASITTGAFGYIQGKKAGEKSATVPLDGGSNTSINVETNKPKE